MAQVRTWAGLDVHAARVVAAVVDGESGELRVQRLPGSTGRVVEFCAGLAGPVGVSYEAGPTGFGLARGLEAAGVGCLVAAPGKIARPAQDRVKTDRRDAELLVRLLMAGQLSAVRVPALGEEALRDLVRAREDVRGDLMSARHRVGKLLLRHDVRFAGNNWTHTLTALGLCAEVGDFDRFERPGQLMSYFGLVPSEHTSGRQRRQGSITKSGSQHARRLLVEAAWHYRRPPRVGRELKRRQHRQPQHVCAISWKTQRRLHRTWQRLDHERGKRRTLVAVAVARELTGFCWALARAD